MEESQGAVGLAGRPADPGPSSGRELSKLVDFRGVCKPPVFSGREAEWPEWRFRFEGLALLLGLDGPLHEATVASDDFDEDLAPAEVKEAGRVLVDPECQRPRPRLQHHEDGQARPRDNGLEEALPGVRDA